MLFALAQIQSSIAKSAMFALVDADSFYCSSEQVFRPDWRGRPVIVLSNNDGCIVAANKQAKAVGIQKFSPYFQVKNLCQRHGVIVCSSNYELYADLSTKMMNIIGRFAPEQYIYSVDETFLSLKNCTQVIGDYHGYGQTIRQAVWREARLPVCVGFGPTLTLAKIANRAAKKLPEYRGVCAIENEQIRKDILRQIAVDDVWGIGRRIGAKLQIMNIKTAFDLSNMPAGLARKTFSIEVERTVRELNGQACKVWDQVRADKRQIFSTRSVGERITDFDELQQALSKHVGIAAAKARKQGSVCGTVLLFAGNSPHDQHPLCLKSIAHLPYPTNSTIELTQAVTKASISLFREGVRYYKIGIGLLDLTSEKHCQYDLFNQPTTAPELMNVLDELNAKYGRDTLFLAAQGIDQKWAMRREFLTPQYSTRWQCLPRIKC